MSGTKGVLPGSLNGKQKTGAGITFPGRNSADMLRAIRSGQYVEFMVKCNLPIYFYWREHDAANAALTKKFKNYKKSGKSRLSLQKATACVYSLVNNSLSLFARQY